MNSSPARAEVKSTPSNDREHLIQNIPSRSRANTTMKRILDPSSPLHNLWAFVEGSAFVIGLSFMFSDLSTFGFTASNSRFVSFVDSFNNCYSFRSQRPIAPREPMSPSSRANFEASKYTTYHLANSFNSGWRRVRTLVLCFLMKYGSPTAVSLLLRKRPPFIQSPRRMLSFLFALYLVRSPWSPLSPSFHSYA